MPNRLSLDQLSALHNKRLELGLGLCKAPSTPGLGFSSPLPRVGGTGQDTFSWGEVNEFVTALSSAPVLSSAPLMGSKPDVSRLARDMGGTFAPSCMLLYDSY